MSVVDRILHNYVLEDRARPVIEAYCRKLDVHRSAVLSPERTRHLVGARREIALFLRSLGWSFPDIGLVLHRHHTTVMNMVGGAPPPPRREVFNGL